MPSMLERARVALKSAATAYPVGKSTEGPGAGVVGNRPTNFLNPNGRGDYEFITDKPTSEPMESSGNSSAYIVSSASSPPESSSYEPPASPSLSVHPYSSAFTGGYAPKIAGFNASSVPVIPIGPNRRILDHPQFPGMYKNPAYPHLESMADRTPSPDDLYAGFYGRPLETFIARSPTDPDVYRSGGKNTHYEILHQMRAEDSNLPKYRPEAVNEDMIVGRTGDVLGHRVTSFWNNSWQEDAVKAYVIQQIREGRLHPDYDLISFRGNNGLMRAGDFVNHTSTDEEKAAHQWTPEEMARAHIDPVMKEAILRKGWLATGMKKRNPWQEALQKHGLLAPGHDWRNPLEASMHGEPIRASLLARARQVLQLALPRPVPKPRPLPDWVPTPTPGKEETTGWVPVSSSWIAGLKYDPSAGTTMTVKKGGKDYNYPGLNLDIFRKWIASKSPGKAWWRYVGYPMQDHNKGAIHNSRFTGPVHRILGPAADGPIKWASYMKYTPHEVMSWLQRHVHPGINQSHVAALTGWLPGTDLYVSHAGPMNTPGGTVEEPSSLSFSVNSPFDSSRTMAGRAYTANRTIHSKYLGNFPAVENDHLLIAPTPGSPFRGVSAGNLLRQMRAAHEVGIPRVHWHAAFGDGAGLDFTGGLHWPTIGADGYMPLHAVREIPPHIREEVHALSEGRFGAPEVQGGNPLHKFSDFMMSPAAREWYRDNPVSHQAFVDTAPGSYSRKAIERHVGEAAVAYGHPAPISDELMPKEPLPTHTPRSQAGIGPNGWKPPQTPLPFAMPHTHKKRYHPALEHLLDTGSVPIEHLDSFFNC